jgi:murein DD-endopeptidase MepM/ murein hydrolase activator NlpD
VSKVAGIIDGSNYIREALCARNKCGRKGKRIEKCHSEGPVGLILTSICSYDSNNRRFSLFPQTAIACVSAMSFNSMKKLTVRTASVGTLYTVSPRRRFRGRHLFIIFLILGTGFGIYRKVFGPKANRSQQIPAIQAAVSVAVESPPQVPAASTKAEPLEKFEIRHVIVKPGDTIGRILEASGISDVYSKDWQKACKSTPLVQIKEDDELIFVLSRADGLPVKVIYSQSDGPSYTLRKNATGWECMSEETAAGGSVKTARGTYSENFYDSCMAGGLPAALITSLADIFSYDIDFTADLKGEDSFCVLFQELPIKSGEGKQFLILGAEMRVSGKVYQAFGFQLPDGSWDYFDSKGTSLKRAFLRSPINYRPLLSSKANRNIKPVVKIFRPRLGIDYSVPPGTSVSAVGDGVVSAIRKNGKKGITIEIRHRGGYRSYYGNLSASNRGLTRGAPVFQAEVIGWVGSAGSGKAYLDFHLHKDSKPVNFRTAEFIRSKAIPKSNIPEFEKSRDFCAAAMQGRIPDGQEHEILSGGD